MSSVKKPFLYGTEADNELLNHKNNKKGYGASSDSDNGSDNNLVIDIDESKTSKMVSSNVTPIPEENKLEKSLKMTIKRKSKCLKKKHEVASHDVSKLLDVVHKCKISNSDGYCSKSKTKTKVIKDIGKNADDPYKFNDEELESSPATKKARFDKVSNVYI